MSEATTLPTKPQPLPQLFLLYGDNLEVLKSNCTKVGDGRNEIVLPLLKSVWIVITKRLMKPHSLCVVISVKNQIQLHLAKKNFFTSHAFLHFAILQFVFCNAFFVFGGNAILAELFVHK